MKLFFLTILSLPFFCLQAAEVSLSGAGSASGEPLAKEDFLILRSGGNKSHWDIYFSGDFLWWTARQEGIAYAVGYRAPEEPTENVAKGKVYAPDHDWSVGYKVGGGANLPYDRWDIYANYTHIDFSARSNTPQETDPNNVLVNQWNLGSPGSNGGPFLIFMPINTPILSGQARWALAFNSLDLSLGRHFFLGKAFSAYAQFGLKGMWQRQNYNVDYQNTFAVPVAVVIDFHAAMRIRSKVWGVGPRAFCEGAFQILKYSKIYGSFGVAALSTHFNCSRKDRMTVGANIANPLLNYDRVATRVKNKTNALKGVIESELGIRFDYQREKSPFRLLLQLGFESQIWISQSALYRRLDQVAHGDLSLYGLTLKGQIDF